MQPTCWHVPKLFEQAPFSLKDRAPDRPNRLIAIYSYLFLSVPILGGDNQPTNQPKLRRPARSRQMPLALAGAPSRRDRPAAELGTRMPRCVLRPMPFAEPAALPPPPLTAPSTTCSSSSSALSTPSTPSTPSSPAPSPPSPSRVLATLAQLELRNAQLHHRSAAALLEARRDAAFRALVALAALSTPSHRARTPTRARRSRSAPPPAPPPCTERAAAPRAAGATGSAA